jgi:hypothetical protein
MIVSHTYDFYSESEIRARELRIRAKKKLREDLMIAAAELKDLEETVTPLRERMIIQDVRLSDEEITTLLNGPIA